MSNDNEARMMRKKRLFLSLSSVNEAAIEEKDLIIYLMSANDECLRALEIIQLHVISTNRNKRSFLSDVYIAISDASFIYVMNRLSRFPCRRRLTCMMMM